MLFYSTLSFASIKYKEHSYRRVYAFEWTYDVINFINAVIATVMSSLALYDLGEARYIVNSSRSRPLESWTVETVCAYITVEVILMTISSYRLTESDHKYIKSTYHMTTIFHLVALAGLGSVLYFNTGYPLAMYVIWTELTSVVMGVKCVFIPVKYDKIHHILSKLVSLLFIVQRILLYFYLVWLSIISFTLQFYYIFQFTILIIGTVLNIVIFYEYDE